MDVMINEIDYKTLFQFAFLKIAFSSDITIDFHHILTVSTLLIFMNVIETRSVCHGRIVWCSFPFCSLLEMA